MNILDDVLASANSDSTKEQKSQNIPSNPLRDQSKKVKGYKSSMSREKGQIYAIDLMASNHHDRPPSSAPRGKTQKKNLKKQKSKKQLNLVERAKKHDQKSVNRHQMDK